MEAHSPNKHPRNSHNSLQDMEYFQRNTQQSEVLQRQNSGIVLRDTVQSISNVMIDVKPINAGQPPRQIM